MIVISGIISTIAGLWAAWFSFNLRGSNRIPASIQLSRLLLLISLYALSRAGMYICLGKDTLVFWSHIMHLTELWIPLLLIYFSSAYTSIPERTAKFISISAALFSFFFLMLYLQNIKTFSSEPWAIPGNSVASWLFYGYFVGSTLLLLIPNIRSALHHDPVHRLRGTLIIAAFAVPLASVLLEKSFLHVPEVDVISPSLLLSLLFLTYLDHKSMLFLPLPIPKRYWYKIPTGGIIIVNDQGQLIEASTKAIVFFPALAQIHVGDPITAKISGYEGIAFLSHCSDIPPLQITETPTNREESHKICITHTRRGIMLRMLEQPQYETTLHQTIQLQNSLLSQAAHDIQSPLIAMYNLSYMLKQIAAPIRDKIDDRFFPELNYLMNRANLMALNLAAPEQITEMIIERISIHQITMSVIEIMQPTIAYHGIPVITNEIEDVLVLANSDLLKLALRNLLCLCLETLAPDKRPITMRTEIRSRQVLMLLSTPSCTDIETKPSLTKDQDLKRLTAELILNEMGSSLSIEALNRDKINLYFTLTRFRKTQFS